MFRQQPLYYPSKYKTTLQYIKKRNEVDRDELPSKIQPQYFLSANEIASWGGKIHSPTNPVQSFVDRERISKMNKKPYFDINAEELEQAVKRLNIQQRLSKQQLNEQQVNGYRKSQVKIHKSCFYLQTKIYQCKLYIYIYIFI